MAAVRSRVERSGSSLGSGIRIGAVTDKVDHLEGNKDGWDATLDATMNLVAR